MRVWPQLAVGVVAVALLTFAVIALGPRPSPASNPVEAGPYRLVVLPFENLLAETDADAKLVPALDEEIRTELSRLDPDRLGVIARTSSQRLGSDDHTVTEIGTQLHVTHVLEGAVRRVNGGLTITARLVNVADEAQVWSDRFVRTDDDVDFALELAPEFAEAHALSADVFTQSSSWDAAEAEAHRALELDPGLARASRVLGDVAMYGRLRIAPAGAWYERAANLAPTDPEALMAWGWWLIVNGDTVAAIEVLQTALHWDPVSPVLYGDGPWFYFFARRFDEAVAESKRGEELLPELKTVTSCQVAVAMVRHDVAEVLRIHLGNAPDDEPSPNLPEFESLVRRNIEIVSNSPNIHNRFSHTARLHALVNEIDQAFVELDRAFDNRETDLIFLASDPRLDNLRSDIRFAELQARLTRLGESSTSDPLVATRNR